MPFADLGDISLWFERRGSGPPLLLIGGTGGDLRRPETRFDGPLARHFDLLAYDQRGLGQSLGQSLSQGADAPYRMADYADDAARLMAAQGWDSASVMGVSFGGMVAQELALRHPARVRKLVLCCTAPGGAGGASFAYHALPPMPREAMAALKVRLSDIRHDDVWAAAHPAAYRRRLALAAADPYADEPGHAEGARRQLLARAGHDAWDRLPAVACPVLVAGGRFDGIVTADVVERLAHRIPGAQLQVFEGGHFFLHEDKRAYAAIIAFLESPP
ncbi:MAG: hypothetical protein BGN82_10260 [Alphaproteobacteria bacterium 65-7]|nr:MAG: hypothetical protein BGN82_10260 [Alphaproteobacteria bacterium 65-7]